ncbi:YybH family protein [Pseudoduganella namucuonensis]|uniref:Ketosteroid isomerase homolog n=1 Tax=Pseudoduganella namucuonensis TaxID=1035707 RepID=A0A1I7L476_9BURK|nr:nuclear transport factor 2 family protein [Pseudoduganella namucuonensis]SFV04543.1 Ketosteroid isomerase homolog [Pseudoduganella namucuonensis]
MRPMIAAAVLALGLPLACVHAAPSNAELKRQVADTERAFAATMAQRDLAGFTSFLADETVFYSGPVPLRGKEQVTQFWKKFYDGKEAPFSWEPDQVDVLDSGTLAHSSGPVYDPKGKLIARFNSVWRLEPSGKWRIVFDKGQDICDCAR